MASWPLSKRAMGEIHCLVCENRVWWRFLLCPEHRAEFGEYKTWPEWLVYLARQERSRRYRQANEVYEYSDSSLDAILEAQRAQGHEDQTWLWLGYVSGSMEKMLEVRSEAVEVLASLDREELAVALLVQFGFTYVEIEEILHITPGTAWRKWAKAKRRLRERAGEPAKIRG